MTFATIAPVDLQALRLGGQPVELIDVRTPVEFREVHADLAHNVPLDSLDPAVLSQGRADAGQPLYVICNSGGRSKQACEKLVAAGVANVVNVEGGTQAWTAAGLPVVRGKKAIALERQVRIAAGSLVLLSVVLGWLVYPAWLALAAFVGAGLIFAGITDTCGMGMLLARMPWNRVKAESSSSCGCRS
jgi:rhodanese-related sulfurtransferase